MFFCFFFKNTSTPIYGFSNTLYSKLSVRDIQLAYEASLVDSEEIKFGLSHMQFESWNDAHTMLVAAAERFSRNGVIYL